MRNIITENKEKVKRQLLEALGNERRHVDTPMQCAVRAGQQLGHLLASHFGSVSNHLPDQSLESLNEK